MVNDNMADIARKDCKMAALLEELQKTRAKKAQQPWSEYREILLRASGGKSKPDDVERLAELADVLGLDEKTIAKHQRLLEDIGDQETLAETLPAEEAALAKLEAQYSDLQRQRAAEVEKIHARFKPKLDALHPALKTSRHKVGDARHAAATLSGMRGQCPGLFRQGVQND